MENLRPPVVAGKFYPANPVELRETVQACMKPTEEPTEALACMLPHAGYIFSGAVAGLTLGQIRLPATALLIGPNHSGRGPELSLWPGGAWRTPLGDVPVDADGTQSLLRKEPLFQADCQAHRLEHSLEVLLPFLQLFRPDLKILALCVRSHNLATLDRAGQAIASLVRERREEGEAPLLITSTDMSHYLPHDQGRKLDALALEQVEKLDPQGLFQVCVYNKISMCGFTAMTLMLFACRGLGASSCRITAHTNSGITGRAYGAGLNSVVGYAGAIIR